MGRKKKEVIEEEKRESKIKIKGDAKRSIAAIFLFALSILFVLGFFGEAGVLGAWLDKIIGTMFGWGKWLSPVIMVASGVILLFRKETSFYVSKLLGLGVVFFSVLGFFHIYFGLEKLLEIAKGGEGGGYAGYAISFLLLKFTGTIAGSVILSALFLAGIIVTFDFSIVSFVQKMLGMKKESATDEAMAEKEKTGENEIIKSNEKPSSEGLIKGPEFVKGPEEEPASAKAMADKKEPKLSFSTKGLSWEKGERKDSFVKNDNGRKKNSGWQFPPLDLLEESTGEAKGGDVKKNAEIIQKTLGHFGIEVELADIMTGPTITQYSFRPAVGIKLSKITGLSSDLALALAAHPIRIEAPIPGKSLVGIEVPNKSMATVRLRDFLQSELYKKRESNLSLSLGKNVSGSYIFGDLDKMPHLMIAGSTGSGKSVCVNSILLSMLYQNSPEDLRFIMVDPKRVELSLYNGIPHLLSDVIVENSKVVSALKWAVGEMERRYMLLQETGSRDIASYNKKIGTGEKRKIVNQETGEITEEDMEKLPYIVIIIDELADLMGSHGKEVEGVIIRIAQMARAVGIHLIISTQRPSVEVLTGLIKANIGTRIAFKVATQIDSRTILDTGGAEKLLGNGDLLYLEAGPNGIRRLQGVFVSESEVKRVVKFIKNQKIERGEESIGEDIANGGETKNNQDKINFSEFSQGNGDMEDSLFEEAKRVVSEAGKASASLLQRRLRVGYSRAARLLDLLEEQGIVGPPDGAKPREVYIASEGHPTYEDPSHDQEARDKWQL
ncbi:MAG: DNA translocase FtsK 4TM domain-containing protein [Parcubacteria group bacterium]|jgi:S-DNA-T family DNA segregation ATPase FtsK/SpoIIIE